MSKADEKRSVDGWDEVKETETDEVQYVDPYMSESDEEDYELGTDDEGMVVDEKETAEFGDSVIKTVEENPSKDEDDLQLIAKNNNINISTLNEKQREDLNVLRRYSTKKVVNSPPVNLDDSKGGRVWKVKIYRDGYVNPKNKAIFKDGKLKSKRPVPVIYENDFFSNLKKVNKKFIFNGKLNDWPALDNLELVSLEYWYSRKDRVKTVTLSRKIWSPTKKEDPHFPTGGTLAFQKKPICIRAFVRSPKYSEIGYSLNNPGFIFWFRPFRENGPKMGHGLRIIKGLEKDAEITKEPIERARKISFFSHRYVKKVETPKDKLTYHTGCLIEWSHGRFCTVIELAYLFGIGGYGGKANWLEDRDSGNPLLWQCMSNSLKAPWKTNRSEIRCIDVGVKNSEEFLKFMKGYKDRFLKPTIKATEQVRLSHSTSTDIVTYLVNYICRDRTYSEEFRNCQTFAADFYTFMSGNTVEPSYPIKLFYNKKIMNFLYDHEMFYQEKKKEKKNQIIKTTSKNNKSPAKKIYKKIFG